MKQLYTGSSRVLITMDLPTGGINILQRVPLAINYDLPTKENYIHRIGRGRRSGREGAAINFVTSGSDDIRMLMDIERK